MPLFSYRATDDDNKEVRGSLDATDELTARSALENLHLEVLEISEASRTHSSPTAPEHQDQLPVFAFEGKDGAGHVRRGTLQAAIKYEAFKRLRDDQKLFLTMLSPVGVLPQYKDPDLDQWQRNSKTLAPAPSVQTATSQPVLNAKPVNLQGASAPTKPAPRTSLGFTNIPEVTKKAAEPSPINKTTSRDYHPLSGTLRLYAGWLLAWYGLFVAVGYFSFERSLPWNIPFVQAFYLSPLIFSFIVAIFIFLTLSAIHKIMKGGLIAGIAFTLVGIGLFFGVKILA